MNIFNIYGLPSKPISHRKQQLIDKKKLCEFRPNGIETTENIYVDKDELKILCQHIWRIMIDSNKQMMIFQKNIRKVVSIVSRGV